jgi:hypothetical protein
MRPMDNITVRLSPSRQAGMTRIQMSGLITTRLGAKDERRLWQLIAQLSEAVCVALPVDTPLSWYDLWCRRLGHARASRLAIRFIWVNADHSGPPDARFGSAGRNAATILSLR